MLCVAYTINYLQKMCGVKGWGACAVCIPYTFSYFPTVLSPCSCVSSCTSSIVGASSLSSDSVSLSLKTSRTFFTRPPGLSLQSWGCPSLLDGCHESTWRRGVHLSSGCFVGWLWFLCRFLRCLAAHSDGSFTFTGNVWHLIVQCHACITSIKALLYSY